MLIRFLAAASVVLPAPAVAQVPIPDAPVIVLPTPAPTPTPVIVPTPTPEPTREPVAAPTPTPQPSPTPTATPEPAATPSPEATPTPAEPAIAAAPVPTPEPSPAATPAPAGAEPFNWLPWLLGGGVLALFILLLARRRRETPEEPPPPPAEEEPLPQPVHRPSARGPWLTVSLRPLRAGLNMITAVADCEITVTNGGSVPAEAIRTALALVAAQGSQVEVDAANAEPIIRPLVPAFTLAPGEAKTFRGVASARLEELATMQAGGRELLVPLVVLNLQHRDPAGVEHRLSQGFVVGVERADSAKLAPFWLDSGGMIDRVAARPSGAPDRRRVGRGGRSGSTSTPSPRTCSGVQSSASDADRSSGGVACRALDPGTSPG